MCGFPTKMNHCQKIFSIPTLEISFFIGLCYWMRCFCNFWIIQQSRSSLGLSEWGQVSYPTIPTSLPYFDLDIPMFFGSSSPARNHLPPGANVPGASAELLTRAQNGAEARSMWPPVGVQSAYGMGDGIHIHHPAFHWWLHAADSKLHSKSPEHQKTPWADVFFCFLPLVWKFYLWGMSVFGSPQTFRGRLYQIKGRWVLGRK